MLDIIFQESTEYLHDFYVDSAFVEGINELVETICVSNGTALRLPFHVARVRASCQTLGWKDVSKELLQTWLTSLQNMPYEYQKGRVMMRTVYDATGVSSVTFQQYQLRPVRSLRCVEADHLHYSLKSTHREGITHCVEQRENCDDVLILRDNLFTDTSIANIALWHEEQQRWMTPTRPLLRGTHRAALLRSGTIIEDAALTLDRLEEFSRIRLFNAMINWGEIELPTSAILGGVRD
jgi:hypothetical protein